MSTPSAPQHPYTPGAGAVPVGDRTLERNAYAIAFRLLGDRPAAAAVAGIAAERLRQSGRAADPDWLAYLTLYALEQTVEPGVLKVSAHDEDRYAGLRTALRRRLARAQPAERVAGALVHLAGYPPAFVGQVIGHSEDQTVELARVLAPPPGIAYRHLGDNELTRAEREDGSVAARRRRWRPRWTTVAVVALLIAAIVVATQMTGPRPILEPFEERGLRAEPWLGQEASAERRTAHPADQGVTDPAGEVPDTVELEAGEDGHRSPAAGRVLGHG